MSLGTKTAPSRATDSRSIFSIRSLLFITTFAIVPATACIAAAAMYAPDAIEKVLTDLAMPLGLLWFGLTWLLVASIHQRRRPGLVAVSAALWLICFLAGNGFLGEYLAEMLEADMKQHDPFTAGPFDTIVVLGGSLETGPQGRTQVNANGDRIVLAARLFHLGRTDRIVCTGARIEGISSLAADEGELAAELLQELAVPAQRITVVGGRTTAEEMRILASQDDLGARVGVVSSAWHLPRVLRLADEQGLQIEPLPAGFISSGDDRIPAGAVIRNLIPRSENLLQISRACKEYLAAAVGR